MGLIWIGYPWVIRLSTGYPILYGYTYTNNVQYENIWGTLPKYTKIREFETIPMFTYVDV